MDFDDYLKTSHQELTQHLSLLLGNERKNISARGLQAEGIDALCDFIKRGKMLRGGLVKFAAQSYGADASDEVLTLSCAVEMMHAALLIHDDIMDEDRTRRGVPTIFAQYETAGRERKIPSPDHYGTAMGIGLGDVALFLAQHLVSKSPKSVMPKLMSYYTRELVLVGLGQMADVEYGMSEGDVSLARIQAVYLYKTARYTFSLPLCLGAILADQPDDELKTLEGIGEGLGMIFQLVDDNLGMWGDERITGKSNSSDIRQNKKTILRSLLFDAVSSLEREQLSQIFGNTSATETDVLAVRATLGKYEIKKTIEKLIAQYSKTVSKGIELLGVSEKQKDSYRDLLNFNLSRER